MAFRREKFVPRGGPSGGDGGDGGDVILVADRRLVTLQDHAYRKSYGAGRGGHGEGKECAGRRGSDATIPVPVGTQVFDAESGKLLADLVRENQRVVVAKGGRGGRGNASFATAVDRAPRASEPGGAGEQKALRLELKLLADVGLLGFPNVGKSTLLAAVSAARPKVADYPFTTLVPHLGVVQLPEHRQFVMADVPGLIQGARLGRGLGTRFLRHLERTSVLLHIVTVEPDDSSDPMDDWRALRSELEAHDPGLANRPEVVAMNKIDLPHVRSRLDHAKARFAGKGKTLYGISAVTREGVPEVLEAVWAAKDGSGPRNPR